jgi:nitrite reductase (NADH) large subunit
LRTLIIGNNVAGTNLAKALRDADANVEVEIFSDEAMPYYPRPRLIDYLAGTVDELSMPFFPIDWYEKNRIKLNLRTKVEKIDPTGKKVLANGTWHPYDKLAIATGSGAFVPPLKGLPKENAFTLRTIEDARRIKQRANESVHLIVIGGGLLGLESARALCQSHPDLRVTVLEYAEHLLMRQLDHEGAQVIQKWLEDLGTKVVVKAEGEEILGGSKVTGVKLKDGRVMEGDLVLISAGTRPNLALARDAGLKVNKGLIVDGSLRTSNPDIFALGDVVEFEGRVWGIIPPALDEAKVAAKKMLGQPTPDYMGTVPSNTLKIMGLDLSSIGTVRSEHEPPEPSFEEIRAGTPDGKVYKKFVIRDGKMIGAILLGTKKDANKVAKMIKDGTPVGNIKSGLSDPDFAFP